jgi:hypothetical protein
MIASCASAESTHILGVSLGVVLLQNGGVLGQQTRLLLFDDLALALLFALFEFLLGCLGLALRLEDDQLLLPKAFDLPLVFQLAHPSSLSIHLLQTLVLRELFHQLALEFFLHAFLFFLPLLLKSELVLACSLQFLSDAHSLLSFGPFLGLCGLLALLDVEVVSELLLEGLLGGALLLLDGQLLEDGIANGFGFLLHGLDLVLSGLLLLGISAHHLVLVLVHFGLPFQKSPLFVNGQDHVRLGLFFLLLDDARLLVVFFNHALHHGVHLGLFLEVLFVRLLAQEGGIVDLSLDLAFVFAQLVQFALVVLPFNLVPDFFVLQHRDVDRGVLFLRRTSW